MALSKRPRPTSSGDSLGTLALRLVLYLGALGGLGCLGHGLLGTVAGASSPDAAPAATWLSVPQPAPAFALAVPDLPGEAMVHMLARHAAGGGRRDTLLWPAEADGPARFRVDIYRPGAEPEAAPASEEAALASTEAVAMARRRGAPLALPQRLRTKFGRMAVMRVPAAAGRRDCLAFAGRLGPPFLVISGHACPDAHEAIAEQRLACALDRLVLLSAGSHPDIARLFAEAELRRSRHCPRGGTLGMAAPLRPALPVQEAARQAGLAP